MKRIDYIYNETDNSCGLCGHKGIKDLTIHHIDGVHENNSYDNQIVLCHNCHCRYHESKGISKKQITDCKKQLMIKTLTVYGVNALKIASRNNFGVVSMPFLLYHLVDLGFMDKKENQMGYGSQEDATARFEITEKGKALYKNWF